MDQRHELTDAINLLADLTEAFTAALFLRERGGESLKAVSWHTLSRSFRAEAAIGPGEGLVGYVFKSGRIVDVDRYQQGSSATRLYDEDEGVKAFLAMPVGEVGVLVVDTKNRQVFGEREKKVVRDFAKFFNHLVMHQETSSREAMYGRILDLLYDIENAAMAFGDPRDYFAEVLDAGRRYSGLSMGFLCLLHPGRKQYTVAAVEGPGLSTLRGRSFPVSQGLVGWVFREMRPLAHSRFNPLKGKSYLISPEEPMRGYNAFVGVPLLAWRSLTGVWAFAGRSERHIEEEEGRALQLAGNRVASTIDHYRLNSGKGV
ncbi:MAG: GAF domain-containing protein [Desulfarculus sp.]|nr:GAF domain-containing protein [Desulfarculus sp.]